MRGLPRKHRPRHRVLLCLLGFCLLAGLLAVGSLGGYDPDEASPALAIARTQAPVLLLHGDHDHHISSAHSVALQVAAGSHAELVLVLGANHDTIAGRAELWPPTLMFFGQHLRVAPLLSMGPA